VTPACEPLPCGCIPGDEVRCQEARRLRQERDFWGRLARDAVGEERGEAWAAQHAVLVRLAAHLSGAEC
jgi:hypothetical protein